MVEVPPIAVPHIIRALEMEIHRQKLALTNFKDDWPPDFDPNDIALFINILDMINESKDGKVSIDHPWGKPAQFAAATISQYINRNSNLLTMDEADALSVVVSKVISSRRPQLS